jgi:DNA invertase Pin-like site-specific DNA recombinase
MSDTHDSAPTQPKSTISAISGGLLTDSLFDVDARWLKRVGGRVPQAVVYVRVSTEEQAKGLSLESQEAAARAVVEERGWVVAAVKCDHASGKSARRPRLQEALAGLGAGEFDALVFSRFDRLSRSVRDFCLILDRADREGWALVSLEPRIDLTSAFHRMFAQLMVIFAELERNLIADRQRESVAARKRAGTYKSPPVLMSAEVEERIAHLVSEGFGARRIARQLELEGFRPPRASVWQPSTVQVAMRRLAA